MKHHSTSTTGVEAPVAGIDVGKDTFHVGFDNCADREECGNDADGRRAVIDELRRRGVRRVGMESTASYSAPLARSLRQAGFSVNVFQPRQVKAFAQFKLKRAKSDKIDCAMIAQCTAMSDPQDAPDPRLAAFCEHLTVIEQIGEDIGREKTRLEHVHDPAIAQMHKEEIKRHTARRCLLIKALVKAVRQQTDLAQKMDLLRSIDGIGEISALTLALRMPELGSISREQAAALLGVAPFIRQSGAFQGERHIAGGRARARRTLFAAAQVACRQWNKALIALYDRLRAKGAHHTAAVIACTRKLVIYANTVLQRQKPWTKNIECKAAL